MRAPNETPRVYSWDTYEPVMSETDEAPVRFGAAGATTDGRRAVRALGRAIRCAPAGVSGVIWTVGLDPIGCARYEYGGIVGRARRDDGSGCVVWTCR